MSGTTPVTVDSLDHLVLAVRDIEATIAFYRDWLGMAAVTFGAGRRALAFGQQKINLHEADREFDPPAIKAARPVPGSADLCFLTSVPTPDVMRSEERRVGNECVSPCRSRGAPYPYKTNDKFAAQ